ncbi:hypothetical protein DVH05_017019 [Phytophthora capsici]|nr:hypothetical protein DVH05_017019 [Phytophthora capsici]
MHKSSVLLLALMLFIAVTAASPIEYGTAANVKTIPNVSGPKERQLRSSVNTEERLEIPGLSKIADFASIFSSTAQKARLWLWLQTQTTPKEAFKLLNLKQLKNSGTKLEKSPELLDWLRYTMAYREMLGSP